MNQKVALRLWENPFGGEVSELAAALKAVADWSREPGGCYDEMFLSKQPVKVRLSELPIDIKQLLDAHILSYDANIEGGQLRSNVMLHVDPHVDLLPELKHIKGIYICTDWPDIPPKSMQLYGGFFDGREMVFPLHYESMAVVRELFRLRQSGREFANALDIFAGSGILGIYSAKLGVPEITFADLNPRALLFSTLNSNMSAIGGTDFIGSNCFSEISLSAKYDLILSNPPFEPVHRDEINNYYWHSAGGPDGQSLMNNFLRDMPTRLTETGCSISVDFLIAASIENDLDRQYRRMLGQSTRLQAASVSLRRIGAASLADFRVRFDYLNLKESLALLKNQPQSATLVLATLVVDRAAEVQLERISTEAAPPPCPWWNPLRWPLPCGVGFEPHEASRWLQHWLARKSDIHADSAAIFAEQLVNPDFPKLEHVDFARYVGLLEATLESITIEEALKSFVREVKDLPLGSASSAETAQLFLLPAGKSGQVIGLYSDSHITTLQPRDYQSFEDLVTHALWDMRTATLIFTFSLLRECRQTDSPGYSDLCACSLTWRGRLLTRITAQPMQEKALLNHDFTFDDALLSPDDFVQRYVLVLRFSHYGAALLEEIESRTNEHWAPTVCLQLRSFIRDRMTALVAPTIRAEQKLQNERARSIYDAVHHYGHSLRARLGKVINDMEIGGLDLQSRLFSKQVDYTLLMLEVAGLDIDALLELNERKNYRYIEFPNRDDPLDLLELIQTEACPAAETDVEIKYDNRPTRLKRFPEIRCNLNTAVVKPVIADKHGKLGRLHKAFYESLMFELIYNAVRHSTVLPEELEFPFDGKGPLKARATIQFDAGTANGQQAFIISNYFTPGEKTQHISEIPDVWRGRSSNDGPGMAASTFRALGLGELYCRADRTPGSEVLQMCVVLDGLYLS